MDILQTVIVTWLATNFGLPADYRHPPIDYMSEAELAAVRYGLADGGRGAPVIALYDVRRNTIILPLGWTASSPRDVSILVHEMVHHLQQRAGLTYACAEQQEAIAYAAQARWLTQFGKTLAQELELDEMTLKVRTSCGSP